MLKLKYVLLSVLFYNFKSDILKLVIGVIVQ